MINKKINHRFFSDGGRNKSVSLTNPASGTIVAEKVIAVVVVTV
jgi:hypothetical protein